MQRLGATERSGQRLHRHAHDVVERLLRGERDTAGLRVKAQFAAGIVGTETLAHEARPQPTRGAELGDLLEEIAMRGEEERQARRKGIDGEPGVDGLLYVGDRISERERHFLHRRGAGFANVVARDGDRIPLRHFGRAEAEHLRRERERGIGRIDVRAARDVFFENVVLYGARQRRARDAAFLGDDNVHREQRGGRRVDGHRRRDFVERNTVEQHVHVVDRIDGDTDPTDFTAGARRVGVDAHLRGQIERDREAGLPRLQQQAESLVGRPRRPEARVLAHRP